MSFAKYKEDKGYKKYTLRPRCISGLKEKKMGISQNQSGTKVVQ
jgi:hypothetical protein